MDNNHKARRKHLSKRPHRISLKESDLLRPRKNPPNLGSCPQELCFAASTVRRIFLLLPAGVRSPLRTPADRQGALLSRLASRSSGRSCCLHAEHDRQTINIAGCMWEYLYFAACRLKSVAKTVKVTSGMILFVGALPSKH